MVVSLYMFIDIEIAFHALTLHYNLMVAMTVHFIVDDYDAWGKIHSSTNFKLELCALNF